MTDAELLRFLEESVSRRTEQIQQIAERQEEIEEIAIICGYGLAALIGVVIGVFILIPFFRLGDKL